MALTPPRIYMHEDAEGNRDDVLNGFLGTGYFESGPGVGSINWNSNYQYQGKSDTFYKLGKVVNIHIQGEFPSDSILFHTDPASAAIYPLIKFNNGVELCAAMWAEDKTWYKDGNAFTKTCLFVSGVFRYNNTTWWPTGTTGMNIWPRGLSMVGPYATGIFTPLNVARTHGVKFFLLTDYIYGQGETEANVTRATSINVMCCLPYQSVNSQEGFQSFSHISSNGLYFTYRSDGSLTDWLPNPQFFYYGYDPAYNGMAGIWAIDNINQFITDLNNVAPFEDDPTVWGPPSGEDPTQEFDPSTPGGGGGTGDTGSDAIDFPGLPTGGALSVGAIKAFEVNQQIITSVFQKLWDKSIFDISTFQKLTDNPMDNLIALQALPFDPASSGADNIKLGSFDTEQAAPVITQEYYQIDCGGLSIEEFWGSALDYSPYTKVEIFLPFIGIKQLNVDDVMGKRLRLKYNYSIFDGNLTAQLKCGESVLYKWPGNVKEIIPVTAEVNDALQRIASAGASIAGGAMRGGAAGAVGGAISSAVNVAFHKTQTLRSGDMHGSTGLLDDFVPYVIIHRPIQSLAERFKIFKGYPSNMTAQLGDVSGYTEVEYIHLTGISGATDAELEMIESQLKSGVIL